MHGLPLDHLDFGAVAQTELLKSMHGIALPRDLGYEGKLSGRKAIERDVVHDGVTHVAGMRFMQLRLNLTSTDSSGF